MIASNEQTNFLIELAETLNRQADFGEILRLVSSRTAALFSADAAAIIMSNPQTQETIKTVIREGSQVDQQQCSLVQTNVIGWIMKNKQPFFSADIKSDRRFDAYLRETFTHETVMCAPLTSRAETIAVGNPVPGRVLAPAKYRLW